MSAEVSNLENYVEEIEQSKEDIINSDATERFLIFKVGVNYYGAPLLSVQEVMEEQTIKRVPYAPSYFLGIMNLRGKIISVLDLRKKFKIPEDDKNITDIPEEEQVKYIMILDLDSTSIGVIIDKIVSVQHLSPSEIAHLPSVEANINSEFLIGAVRVDEKLVTLVQLSKLIESEEVARFVKQK